MTYASGACYRGEWKQGLKHGKGSMIYSNQDIYSGDWQNVSWNRNINIVDPSIFLQDFRSGEGAYLFSASGARAEGKWEVGNVVDGSFLQANGTRYTGAFIENRYFGKGQFEFLHSNLSLRGEVVERAVHNQDYEDEKEIWWIGDI